MSNSIRTAKNKKVFDNPFYMCIMEFEQRRFYGGSRSAFIVHIRRTAKRWITAGNCFLRRDKLKKLEIIIKPEKLEDLKAIFNESEVNGLNIVNTMGYGNQKGIVKQYRGEEYKIEMLPKIKVETVVADEEADALIERVVNEIKTGNYGDGKIFVMDVQDAIRIRTGEHGNEAL